MSDYDLPKSSLDFAGMGALRGQAQRREEKATRETATQFEAMYDRELSVQLAKRNTLGVADMLVKSIDRSKEAGAAYKAKAEPMTIKPEQETLPLSGPKAIELLRPEKFNVKPRSVTPVTDAGVE